MNGIKIKTNKNKVRNKEESIWKKDFKVFKVKLSDKDKQNLYRQLHTLSQAKVDINTILEVIISEKEKDTKEVFSKIQDDLIQGKSLSKSFQSSKLFSDFEIFSIKVGEESGNSEAIYYQLIKVYQRKIKQKNMLINALSYPVLVLFFAIITTIFMLKFIVPIFTDAFKQFGGELPWLTQKIIYLSSIINDNFIVLILLSLSISFLIFRYWTNEKFKVFRYWIILKIPIVGELIKQLSFSQLFSFWKLMFSAKIPMNTAIELLTKTTKLNEVKVALKKCNEDLLKGKTIYNSFKQSKLFNQQTLALIRVGEDTNKLDIMFEKLSESFQEEAEHKIEILGSVIEPILIVLIGSLVGVILIALYMPMFEMSNTI